MNMDVNNKKLKSSSFGMEEIIINREHLLQVLSWIDFIPKKNIAEKDMQSRETIIKIINYLTRND